MLVILASLGFLVAGIAIGIVIAAGNDRVDDWIDPPGYTGVPPHLA